MNWLDVILGGAVIISALVGIGRGFIKEVLSLLAWVIALYVAWKFSDIVAEQYVQEFIDDPLISYLAAFGVLFLVSLFVIGLANLLITQLFSATGMSGFDRLLGMLFGVARGALISALIVFFASFTPIVKEPWWQSSKLAPGFANLAAWGMGFLPNNIIDVLNGQQTTTTPNDDPLETLPEVPPLNLESASGNIANTPTRPQIDSSIRSQQSAQNNALSSVGEPDPLTLESIEDNEQATREERSEQPQRTQDDVQQAPAGSQQTEQQQSSPPPLTLESIQ